MKRALVIADDLSGAAEIAGIGQRYGLATRIFREPGQCLEEGLTVFDTDSRSLPPHEAAARVGRFLAGNQWNSFDFVFKKTDSVLRGPIVAEIHAILDHFLVDAAYLLPQNPSRGRAIVQMKYFIDEVPLDQTPFAHDPEYPAQTSNVIELLGGQATLRDRIAICNASAVAGVDQWASAVPGYNLRAGGADFFEASLRARGLLATNEMEAHLSAGPTLYVCGSASAYSRALIARARSTGIPILAIEQAIDRAPGVSQLLLDQLTDSAAQALRERPVANLMLEGGATAAAVCRRMGWNDLAVCGELAVGVVHLRAGTQDLYIKPGSYPWPDAVWKDS